MYNIKLLVNSILLDESFDQCILHVYSKRNYSDGQDPLVRLQWRERSSCQAARLQAPLPTHVTTPRPSRLRQQRRS